MAAPQKGRKSPRAQVSLVARYRSPTAFEFVKEECFDLSAGGMFIKSPAPAPAGTLIKLECDVDHGAQTIRGVARVVWLRELDSEGQPAGMGVKFVKLESGGREAIRAVLLQLGPEFAEPEATVATRSSVPPRSVSDSEPFARSPSSSPRGRAAVDPQAVTAVRTMSTPPANDSMRAAPAREQAEVGDLAQLDAPFTKGPSDARGLTPTPSKKPPDARSLAPTVSKPPSDARGLSPTASAKASDSSGLDPTSSPKLPSDARALGPATRAEPSAARGPSQSGKPSGPPSAAANSVAIKTPKPAKMAPSDVAATAKPAADVAATTKPAADVAATAKLAADVAATAKPAAKDKPKLPVGAAAATGSRPQPVTARVASKNAASVASQRGPRALIYGGAVALAAVTLYATQTAKKAPAADTATRTQTQAPAPETPVAEPEAELGAPPGVVTPPMQESPTPTGSPAPAMKYVLEIVTTPEGAQVTAAGQSVTAPATLDLGALTERVQVIAEKRGFQAASAVVDRVGFMLDEGQMRRRIALTLAKESPELASSVATQRAPRKPAPVAQKPARGKSAAAATTAAPKEPAASAKPEAIAAEPKGEATSAPTPAAVAAAPAATAPKAATKQTPMETATACLTTGDNACVVNALEGRAKSAAELELLIETYRAMGSADKADKEIAIYLEKYPAARRAIRYRRVLERRKSEAQPVK